MRLSARKPGHDRRERLHRALRDVDAADRFAGLVRDTVGESFRALLDEPRQIMTAVHAAFQDSGRVG